MTEAEWLSSSDLMALLRFREGRASDRKLRLLACACCRRIWHLLGDPRSREAVEVAERYADGEAGPRELAVARNQALEAAGGAERQVAWAAYWATNTKAGGPIDNVCEGCAAAPARAAALTDRSQVGAYDEALTVGARAQVAILRDVLGNPFHPVSVDPSWLTPAVLAVASHIYAARDFGALPILADALEEAGCAQQNVLDHCRLPGEHVRGCWALDLVLAKE